jgi:serine/threonine-protein kinase
MPTSGLRFGRYELRERLGAGGMGEVFRARDCELQRDVAIKFLSESCSSDPKRLARFAAEARAASALNHPNILTIHDVGETSGRPFIVMECVEGRTLRHLLQDRPLAPKRTLDIAVQLSDGLAKAHAAGIVHRDLKPENVMVTTDGLVKIVDFGLARPSPTVGPADDAGSEPTETRAPVLSPDTAEGAVLGTVGYMAPEQARGEPVDHRSDQFALGAILYEMATGRRAFHCASSIETLAAIIDRDPEPIARLNPSFPAPARWPIERCLAKRPADRYAATEDLAHELRTVRDHLDETTVSQTGTNEPVRRRGMRPRQWAALAALVLATAFFASPLRTDAWRWLAGPQLPAERRIAVLPVDAAGEGNALSRGLLEYVVMRLAELNTYDSRISVVPASEITEAGVRNPSGARKKFGATIAVSISIIREGADLVVNVALADTEHLSALGGDSVTLHGPTPSREEVVSLVMRTLRVRLQASEKVAWDKGAPAVAEAAALFAEGLTPYQQARAALQKYEQEDRLAEAISLFNKAIDLDPRYAAAWAGLGEAQLRRYRLTKDRESLALAETALRNALRFDDTRPTVWISLGMLHVEQGESAEAERAFQRAIVGNPKGADAYRELGLAYQQAGQLPKAEAAYLKAIALDPTSWSNHSHLGFLRFAQGRYGEAEKEFRVGLTFAEDNARLWSNLGAVYMATGRWDEAETALKTAIEKNPRYAAAISNLAYSQFQHGRYADAAATFERAAEFWPREADIWRNVGSARYFATGDHQRSAPAYERAAQLLEDERTVNPTDPHILVRLADCYASLDRASDARALVADALRRRPQGDDLRVGASVYEQLGDRGAALRLVRAALDAGVPPSSLESSRSLDKLRVDPRYAALLKATAERIGSSTRSRQ